MLKRRDAVALHHNGSTTSMVPARSQIRWQISSGSEWGRSGVGTVRIRLYRVRKGRGYWEPTARMKAAGFRLTALGPDGPEAWGQAERLNAAWDKARRNDSRAASFEPDTLGWLFEQYRHTGVWAAKAPRTREEWELAWRTIGPVFGDLLVAKINFRACDAFYTELGKTFSLHGKHRVFKILRALLEVAIAFQLIGENPTHRIANSAPKGRSAIWYETEVTALRDKAWDMGFHGLSVAIAVCYDTAMAPVDVRLLTLAMQRRQNRDVTSKRHVRRPLATSSRPYRLTRRPCWSAIWAGWRSSCLRTSRSFETAAATPTARTRSAMTSGPCGLPVSRATRAA